MSSVPDGKADIALIVPTAPQIVEGAAKPPGLRFIEFPVTKDPEGLQRYLEIYTTGEFAPAPHVGVKEIWDVVSLSVPRFLLSRADMSPELAYNLIKWLDENYGLYKDKHPDLELYDMKSFRLSLDSVAGPVHEGVIKYLKEKGRWSAADDLRQQYNLRVLTAYEKAYKEAMDRANKQSIKVDPSNDTWIKLWSDYKKEKKLPIVKTMSDAQIKDGLKLLDSLGF
jgi:hypothetical protein